ncbi:MAG TPA: DsbA family oxidoreductase [Solirubrobacterales bacterium]|jgi:predicted DsbA family dithiol-disulfide isomerase|nr:DsbA family oxidoreductase [Solirubrobacterales bacterium]
MKVEIWSDVACPWCYLGKRHLEEALARYDEGEVEVVWRSFQLQPDAPHFGEPGAGAPTSEYLAARGYAPDQLEEMQGRLTQMAAAAGLSYRLDLGRHANTFDAHALIHAAARQGLGDAMVERLFAAQHVEGLRLDDPAVLADLAAEVGLTGEAATPTEADRQAVRDDIAEAQRIGVNGVPFLVIDRRLAVSGAQPADVLLQAFAQASQADAPA